MSESQALLLFLSVFFPIAFFAVRKIERVIYRWRLEAGPADPPAEPKIFPWDKPISWEAFTEAYGIEIPQPNFALISSKAPPTLEERALQDAWKGKSQLAYTPLFNAAQARHGIESRYYPLKEKHRELLAWVPDPEEAAKLHAADFLIQARFFGADGLPKSRLAAAVVRLAGEIAVASALYEPLDEKLFEAAFDQGMPASYTAETREHPYVLAQAILQLREKQLTDFRLSHELVLRTVEWVTRVLVEHADPPGRGPLSMVSSTLTTFSVSAFEAFRGDGRFVAALLEPFSAQDIQKLSLFPDVADLSKLYGLSRFDMTPAQRQRYEHSDRHFAAAWLATLADAPEPLPELAQRYLAPHPVLGPFTRTFLQERLIYALPGEARFEHVHILAGSGHGKTQCLEHLIIQSLFAAAGGNHGCIVLDSQGDLIKSLTQLAIFDPEPIEFEQLIYRFFPDKFRDSARETFDIRTTIAAHQRVSLADRLILIDPKIDIEHPPGLNLFDMNLDRFRHFSSADRERLLNATIDLYSYFFSSLLGAELTQKQAVVFGYVARALMHIPKATIRTLRDFLEKPQAFRSTIEALDPDTRHFFDTQLFGTNYHETRQQILNRLYGILSKPIFQRMLASETNTVDMFEAMQSGKIVLINTAKDALGSEYASIFGRFFIALITQATLARAALPEDERRPCMLYIDEAQDYFDRKIDELMNQARKYRVGITLAHQHLDQLSAELQSTILASTSTKIVGGVNAKDAGALAREMQCDKEFIQGQRKVDRKYADFACSVRHHTKRPFTLRVPFGYAAGLPQLREQDYRTLLARNRAALSAPEHLMAAEPLKAYGEAPAKGRHSGKGGKKHSDDDSDFYVS